MPRSALLLLLAAACAAGPVSEPAQGRRAGRRGGGSAVVLDGERTQVTWSDGDTFRIRDGPHRGRSVRLAGVNALEGYGPVHRFAGMSGDELLAIARAAKALVRAGTWSCETQGGSDAYSRLLASCPDVAEALVRAGYAMVLAVDEPPYARLVASQRAAQDARAGMWARGAPPVVPTSLHSADEPGRRWAYDRVADTRTGTSSLRRHRRVYAACEEVCVGEGEKLACMTYVPFDRQHRNRPPCLAARSSRAASSP